MFSFIKKFIPKPLKRFAWFLFKAPQRQYGFVGTLWRDIKGFFRFQLRFLFPIKAIQITVCVGIANRFENFKQTVVPSFKKAQQEFPTMQLSVFEMGGNEEQLIQEEVQRVGIENFVFNRKDEKFYRSGAFNQAVKQSTGEILFLCDADIEFNPDFIKTALQIVKEGVAWFPICYALGEGNKTETGKWMEWDSKGLVVCTRKDFEKIGMLNEFYTSWGAEDVDLWIRFHKNDYVVLRNKFEGLFHHWHEPNPEKLLYNNPWKS
jgi:hypothetical protein